MSATETILMEKEPPSLEAAQKAVGGFVEILPVREGQLLFNEEGRMQELPENPTASMLAGQPIVGNALFLKGSARWD